MKQKVRQKRFLKCRQLPQTVLEQSEKPEQRSSIKLKSLEALEKVADGKATKIIIPSEIQNLAGLVTSIKEVATQPDPVEEADNYPRSKAEAR